MLLFFITFLSFSFSLILQSHFLRKVRRFPKKALFFPEAIFAEMSGNMLVTLRQGKKRMENFHLQRKQPPDHLVGGSMLLFQRRLDGILFCVFCQKRLILVVTVFLDGAQISVGVDGGVCRLQHRHSDIGAVVCHTLDIM